jgi:hypothetical protein
MSTNKSVEKLQELGRNLDSIIQNKTEEMKRQDKTIKESLEWRDKLKQDMMELQTQKKINISVLQLVLCKFPEYESVIE